VIAAINEGYVGTVPLNEALKNRFVVIEVPYIEGEQLKQLIETNTKLKDPRSIDLFVKLSSDLINAVNQGKVAEDAASIRALLDACDLSVLIPPKRAIVRFYNQPSECRVAVGDLNLSCLLSVPGG
jgi:nitric oxide reductase NorQ protein